MLIWLRRLFRRRPRRFVEVWGSCQINYGDRCWMCHSYHEYFNEERGGWGA